ncbi:MAG: glucose-6-phosphate isomerase [Candidatus Portnoybacteria bacterium]|nr:glucose-6-phosphate isomerase [Candidatus Portnoybacteria bacterium]
MNLENKKPNIRHLHEMKEVIYDKEWLSQANLNMELYYMYRDLTESQQDKEEAVTNQLRYDITVLLPVMLGKEYNKTKGHDHPKKPNTNLTYPELYEVLEGEAIFLIQDSQENAIKDVKIIRAKKNDKIIIPPNYEHVMINPTEKEAKTCNWVYRGMESNIYEPFIEKQGFSYYAIKEENNIKWIRNQNYKNIPLITEESPNKTYQTEIPTDEPVYELINNPEKLDFLKNPQNYNWG